MYTGSAYPELLDYWARICPDKVAATFEDTSVTYSQLALGSSRLANAFRLSGVEKGDYVIMILGNGIEFVGTFFAILKIGAIAVPLDTAVDYSFVKTRIDAVNPKIVVVANEQYAERLVRDEPSLNVVTLSAADGIHSLSGMKEAASSHFTLSKDYSPFDPCLIAFTSGSTGTPKGALHTYENIFHAARNIGYRMHANEDDVFLVPIPISHMFGLITGTLLPLLFGCKIVLLRKFKIEAALKAVEEHRCSVMYGVPAMFASSFETLKKLGGKAYDVSSLRTGMVAGAFCPPKIFEGIKEHLGIEVLVGYGSTETISVCTTLPEDTVEDKWNTVGRVFDGNQARIVDTEGNDVGVNNVGELIVKGYSVMSNYFDFDDKLESGFDADGWFHLGDLASMDERGYITIRGRIKDLIIRGGNNVEPTNVETVYADLPGASSVCVIGRPDDILGEAIVLFVESSNDEAISLESVREHGRGRLPKFSLPDDVIVLEQFPVLPNGKIDKKMLEASLNPCANPED